jgi:hypothetical protein
MCILVPLNSCDPIIVSRLFPQSALIRGQRPEIGAPSHVEKSWVSRETLAIIQLSGFQASAKPRNKERFHRH